MLAHLMGFHIMHGHVAVNMDDEVLSSQQAFLAVEKIMIEGPPPNIRAMPLEEWAFTGLSSDCEHVSRDKTCPSKLHAFLKHLIVVFKAPLLPHARALYGN